MSDPQHFSAQPQGHPSAPYYSAPPQAQNAAPAGSLGRIAFIIALVALAIGLLVSLSFPIIVRTFSDYSLIGVVTAVGNGLVLISAIAALVLGLISVRRPGPQILAGIAIGISASSIVGILVAWVSNLIVAVTYS